MKQTKQWTEAAVLAALYMVLFTIVFFVPFFGTLLLWVLPLPFIINVVRNGRNAGVAMAAITLVLSLFFGIQALPLTWTFASAGVVVGELYRRKASAFFILLGGSLAYIFNLVLLYILFILFAGINPVMDSVESLRDMFIRFTEDSSALMPEMNQDQLASFLASLEMLQYLVPSILVMTGLMFALLTQLIANGVLRRLHIEVEPWKPFSEWTLPKSLIWYYLAVLILSLIGLEEGTPLFIVTSNLLLILEYAMIVQGFTVVFAFSRWKGWSRAVPIIVVVGSVLFVFPLQLVKLLGIIDLGFNLRKRMTFK